jgi:ribosomal protein S18 acetylase RimI-like enzyme
MSEAAARCRARGGRELSWAVFPPNRLSVAFYERLGARFYNTAKFMHISVADL